MQPTAGSRPSRVLDVATRQYLVKVGARWSPLVLCTLVLVLVVSLSPSASSTAKSSTNPLRSAALVPGASAGTTQTTTGAATSAGGAGAPGGASSPAVITATTSPLAPGSPGLTRTGIACGPGVLQVTWSAYAPLCVPAFKGDNGGSTAKGVTSSTITISYREPNSTQQSAAQSLAGDAFPDDNGLIQDMQTYIKYFNTQFELYGRKLQMVPYQGQGDYLSEDEGQDLAATQADAETAAAMPAFGDLTFPLFGSQYYEQDLAQAGVVGIGGLGFPLQWYEQYAPYEYSVTPTGTAGADGFVNIACDRMAGLPAIFAGDATYQKENRVFGLIAPDNPEYQDVANLIENGMQQTCGQKIKSTAAYAIDIASFEQQAVSIMAQMKAAGVTTVICGCDPLFPILLTQAADQQQYYPEWLGIGWYDPQGRLPSQDQQDHTISQEGESLPTNQTEAYKVFQLADPGAQPAEQYFSVAYYSVLYLFDLLQAAGPDLNPATLQRAAFSMPTSGAGNVGTWQGGSDAFSPVTTTQIGWWNPDATSNFDGKQGAWQSCEAGKWFTFLDPDAWQPDHTQLNCFGH